MGGRSLLSCGGKKWSTAGYNGTAGSERREER
jgi:hypothetical protein